MQRRTFLGASLAAATVGASGCSPRKDHRPNIIFIMADDLGYADCGYTGQYKPFATLNFDRLARGGATFFDAHSPSAVCTPTRYGILTGRYAWRTWMTKGVLGAYGSPLIEADRPTLPKMLKTAGYATSCIGKWHLGFGWARKDGSVWPKQRVKTEENAIDFSQPIDFGPLNAGFDYFFGVDAPNYPPYAFIENDRILGDAPSVQKPENVYGLPGLMQPGWDIEAVFSRLADKTIEEIERLSKDKAPFYLHLPLTGPHTPITPSEKFRGKSGIGPYGDYVLEIDDLVGRIVDTIAKSGSLSNTLIVFCSDNGSPSRTGVNHEGAAGSLISETGYDPNAPWRGLKGDIYEGGHRIPLIVHWPKAVPEGMEVNETVMLSDWFATVCDIIGVEKQGAPDSVSLWPLMRADDPVSALPPRATVQHAFDGMTALRYGQYKLIEGDGSGGFSRPRRVGGESTELKLRLFDLDRDPGETNDIAAENPHRVRHLANLLQEIRTSGA